MKYKTIIWDLDGTLMDTLLDLMSSINYALEKHGMPVRTYQEIRSFLGNGVKRLIELSVPDGLNNPSFEKVFADFKSHYIEHCQAQKAPTVALLHYPKSCVSPDRYAQAFHASPKHS